MTSPLQLGPACGIDRWTAGEWMSCIFDPVTALLGSGLYGLLTSGAILMAFWLAGNRSLAAPSVAMILISGLAIPILPGGYQGVAWTVAFVGVAGGVFSVIRSYML
jgi:hypothetical protein